MKKNNVLVFIIFITCSKLFSCPFTITNDSNSPIIITDNDKQAVYIEPNQTQVIDPTLQGFLTQLLFNEKLNIYVQEKPGAFYQKYQLIERYCVEDWKEKNTFSLSQLLDLIKKPTDRLRVITFERKKIDHEDNHHH